MVAGAAEVSVVGCSLLVTVGRADAAVHVENDLCRRVTVMNPVDPYPVHVGQGFNVRIGGQKLRFEASIWLEDAACLATALPPTIHRDRIEAEPVGIVHVVVAAKTAKEGLAELPDKIVATVLPTTGVRECVPGNLGQSDCIVQFPVRQQASVGSDLGTMELKLQATVKIEPQNPRFRFTHWVVSVRSAGDG